MTSEFSAALVLSVLLLSLAVWFAWRAVQALRAPGLLGPEDRRYHRIQAWRRIVSAGLMVACAAMIAGWFFLEDLLSESAEAAVLYWVAVLLLVLAIIFLAACDFWAIARFGLRHHRQIQSDRRAMLERQVERLRSQRNGHPFKGE